ncbi:MAG: rRNA-processing protein RimM [Bacilli bacterium]|nr:rRNA-processing protein RimM [Bacilli bacterium]
MSEAMYNVGKIVNTQGIKGELKVLLQTDFPEERFKKGSKLILLDAAQSTQMIVEVESGRLQKNVCIVKFAGFNDINQVEKYKGWVIKVKASDLLELDQDEYYYHEIIGCRVVTDEGEELGTISEILTPGANDVWVVDRPASKPVLLPVIDEVVLQVDVRAKLVTVSLMEGLID